MAEERIIDDEYGRGVKLRKTKDGYVDVTDELAESDATEEADEVTFEFPMMEDEDDEDLVGLSPEEAQALKQQKIEAAERRRAEYAQAVEEGYGEATVSAFKKLAKDNFAHLAPSRINVVLEYSHPPLSERIAAVERLMAENKSGK